jgi:hypothetical protein
LVGFQIISDAFMIISLTVDVVMQCEKKPACWSIGVLEHWGD